MAAASTRRALAPTGAVSLQFGSPLPPRSRPRGEPESRAKVKWARDCLVKVGKLTSFPRSVKLKPGETVVFSWIVYKSRADRDRVNAKVMHDLRLAGMMSGKDMPFDGKRLIYGGFDIIVDVGS